MFGVEENNFSTFVIFCVVLLLTYYFLSRSRQRGNLPPGPTSYPLVGNLPQFFGKNFTTTLRTLQREYGNIYIVKIWGKRIIVISGYENIKAAFVNEGSKFAYRPETKNTPFKGHGLLVSSGEMWKHNRRFTIHTLKDLGMGKNQLQIKIHEEIRYFLDAIEEHKGQPFDIKNILNIAVSNIICSMVFGKRYDYHDETSLSYIHALDEVNVLFLAVTSKPEWLRYIPGDPFDVGKFRRLLNDLEEFYMREIDGHQREVDTNNTRDLIDAYIKQMNGITRGSDAHLMNIDNLLRVIHDLFIAGTETTTTTLRFAMLFLLQNPNVQTKLSDDLQNKVPCNRLPNLSDKSNLSYLEATIFEILRQSCLAPFAIPHFVNEETKLMGYTIPAATTVMPNLKSVLMDDNLWDNPHVFNPSRFLDADMRIKNTEYLIPFSIGPRVCLGEGLARMELYLFLSAMLQRFQFLPPEGENPPKLDVNEALVCSPKPFKLRAILK